MHKTLAKFIPLASLPPWLLVCLVIVLLWVKFSAPPRIENFQDAKYYLKYEVFFDHPLTLYCAAKYDDDNVIEAPQNFKAGKYENRAGRMEWEHAAPAEHFGRNFKEWKSGAPECVRNGEKFYGRKCVAQVSEEFRLMEADMYNIFPAIGAVNAMRGNREYAELPDLDNPGQCGIKMRGKKFEPPDRAKGQVARAALYMAEAYDKYAPSPAQRKLFEEWNRKYPVDSWECKRARRIEKLQKKTNSYIKIPCQQLNLW